MEAGFFLMEFNIIRMYKMEMDSGKIHLAQSFSQYLVVHYIGNSLMTLRCSTCKDFPEYHSRISPLLTLKTRDRDSIKV